MLAPEQAQALLQRYQVVQANVAQRGALLVAVSKSHTADAMALLAEAGQQHFAENYWQEAQAKMQALQKYPLVWHFIGRIQENKAAEIAAHFDWVHSLDSIALVKIMAKARQESASPLQVCLQVNINQEPQKGGVMTDAIMALADAVAAEPRLKLRGLMAVPQVATPQGGGDHIQAFAEMRQHWLALKQHHISVDTLSLGMSADYMFALDAGATMVRIGQAIFGQRKG